MSQAHPNQVEIQEERPPRRHHSKKVAPSGGLPALGRQVHKQPPTQRLEPASSSPLALRSKPLHHMPRMTGEPAIASTPPSPVGHLDHLRDHQRHSWSPEIIQSGSRGDITARQRHSNTTGLPDHDQLEALHATLNDVLPHAGHDTGIETMQSIVRRGLGSPMQRPTSPEELRLEERRQSLMPLAAADEATLDRGAFEEAMAPLHGQSVDEHRNRSLDGADQGERVDADSKIPARQRGRGWFGVFRGS